MDNYEQAFENYFSNLDKQRKEIERKISEGKKLKEEIEKQIELQITNGVDKEITETTMRLNEETVDNVKKAYERLITALNNKKKKTMDEINSILPDEVIKELEQLNSEYEKQEKTENDNTKELYKEIEQLEKEANDLNNRFTSINEWIKNNPQTYPNMYEMMDCICEFEKLKSQYDYYSEKYSIIPNIVNDDVHNLKEAYKSLLHMIELRYNHKLFKDSVMKEFFTPIIDTAMKKGFEQESDEVNSLRKNILCKCSEIYRYIYETQNEGEPDYIYDNKEEFENLKADYKKYLEMSKGKQFKDQIDIIISAIDKNYAYSNNKEEVGISDKEKLNIELNKLQEEAKQLNNRFRGINEWIKNNPNEDPNLFEMVDCVCEFGKLHSLYDQYYKKHNMISEINSEEVNSLFEANKSLQKMFNSRIDHKIFKDITMQEFFIPIYKAAINGEFKIESDEVSNLRKNILSKCAEVYKYIYLTKLNEPNYKYDNKDEFERLKADYEKYIIISENGQFKDQIDDMIDAIDMNYLYSDNYGQKGAGPKK